MVAPEFPDAQELRRMITEALLTFERAEEGAATIDAARQIRELAESLELSTISDARQDRISWAKIGTAYGLTKQGAQQRFGDRIANRD